MLHKHFGKYICGRVSTIISWVLFAPQPVSKNFLIGFEIEFEDGTIQAWKLPEYTLKNDYQWTSLQIYQNAQPAFVTERPNTQRSDL